MTSTHPPVIEPLPGTPAQDAASALDPTQEAETQRPPLTTKLSGPDVPGAYPAEREEGQPRFDPNAVADLVKQVTLNTARNGQEYLEAPGNAASRIVGAAREYIPAKEQVQNITRSMMDTARQYLPETVSAYLPETTSASNGVSLPTTENAGAQPGEKSSGVGALPGPIHEPGVAVLPEERPVEADNPQVVTGVPNGGQPVGMSGEHTPEKQIPEHHANEGVGGTGGPGGVGTMEWSEGETGVALLPDEKVQGEDTDPSKFHGKSVKGGWPIRGVQGGIGTLSWAGSDSSIAKLPDEKNATNGDPRGRDTPSRVLESHDKLQEQHDGYGADYHPAELHPRHQEQLAGDMQKSLPSVPASGHSNGHGSGKIGHKPKFVDRVKGEAKIIAGKIGGNEEKIEQGMRLKGKDV